MFRPLVATFCLFAVAEGKPNVVFILTDDQDTKLGKDGYTDFGSLASQPVVQKLLMDEGTRMSNYFVNTPICCPSRTEYFTGRYFHNVRGAGGQGCMHANTTHVGLPNEGMFGLLTNHGYTTGVFGKTTNDQSFQLKNLVDHKSATYIDSPLNYNDYMGLTYFRYFPNGTTYTETIDASNPIYGTPYQTTQIGNRSTLWLESVLKTYDPEHPFFLYLGPHAPHFPATPAPWYEHLWDTVGAPVTPNYNISSPDKTQHIRQNPPLTDTVKCWEDQHFRDRWSSLASVDDLLQAVHDLVEKYNQLDNTYFFYASDHGYKFGQWRVGVSKQHPYETDVRVPFIAKGPGIPAGKVVDAVAGNVDLLPTILELVGVEVPGLVDGKSMAGVLKGSGGEWRTKWLNEYESVGTYYNDHSPCWAPEGYESKCGGPLPRGPSGVPSTCVESTGEGDGNCYFVDSTHSNTWRALRTINATHNTQYIEYDPTWAWNASSVVFNEYYDITSDPYQITNLYTALTAAVKQSLHDEVSAYYSCHSASCP